MTPLEQKKKILLDGQMRPARIVAREKGLFGERILVEYIGDYGVRAQWMGSREIYDVEDWPEAAQGGELK